jgi:hypothetical protein
MVTWRIVDDDVEYLHVERNPTMACSGSHLYKFYRYARNFNWLLLKSVCCVMHRAIEYLRVSLATEATHLHPPLPTRLESLSNICSNCTEASSVAPPMDKGALGIIHSWGREIRWVWGNHEKWPSSPQWNGRIRWWRRSEAAIGRRQTTMMQLCSTSPAKTFTWRYL